MSNLGIVITVAFCGIVAFAYFILPYVRRKRATSQLSAMLDGSVEVEAGTQSSTVIISGVLRGRNARAKLRMTDDPSQSTVTLELMARGTRAWSLMFDGDAAKRQQSAWATVDDATPVEFASPNDAPNVVCTSGADAWRRLPDALRHSIAQLIESKYVRFSVDSREIEVVLGLKDGMAAFRRGFELMDQVADYYEGAGVPGATVG